jgi:hypothetical protein
MVTFAAGRCLVSPSFLPLEWKLNVVCLFRSFVCFGEFVVKFGSFNSSRSLVSLMCDLCSFCNSLVWDRQVVNDHSSVPDCFGCVVHGILECLFAYCSVSVRFGLSVRPGLF